MDDCIIRQAAFDAFNKLDYDICANETFDNLRGYYGFSEETVNQTINSIPSEKVKPIVYGNWSHLGGDEWCCTNCGNVINTEGSWEKPTKKFCDECGADMREEQNETDLV